MKTMIAARMHENGGPMTLDEVPVPEVRPTDVLVKVEACGMVPNLGNVLAHWKSWFPHLPLPDFPATFGLDPAGVVAEVGSQVLEIQPGERVYVNPGRACGSCRSCLAGEMINCPNYTFQGYFGFGPKAQRSYDAYPFGGFAEYVTAPQYALVRLPGNVSFEQAARFGYLGTGYAALQKAGAGPGTTLVVNGASGTLGLGVVLNALALGVARIFGTGRNAALLERVKAIAPERIEVLALGERSIGEWARELTGGWGVDATIDALGPGAPMETMTDSWGALRRGGRAVDVGAVAGEVPLDVHWFMDNQLQFIGSNWFTPRQGQEMADLAGAGILDLSVFEHHRYPLAEVNEAISGLAERNGGFSNYVVVP